MTFLALAGAYACAPRAQRCDLSHSREIAFTGSGGDTLTVRAIGPSCDKAVGLYVVRDAEERPIWSWSAPMSHAFVEVFAADEPEAMESFLARWADPVLTTTQSAPEWSALARDQTTLDQLTYEDIRARDLPMLCHFSGTARQVCAFWEPAAGGAGLYYERDVEENEE